MARVTDLIYELNSILSERGDIEVKVDVENKEYDLDGYIEIKESDEGYATLGEGERAIIKSW